MQDFDSVRCRRFIVTDCLRLSADFERLRSLISQPNCNKALLKAEISLAQQFFSRPGEMFDLDGTDNGRAADAIFPRREDRKQPKFW
jgi:hypothetical protein